MIFSRKKAAAAVEEPLEPVEALAEPADDDPGDQERSQDLVDQWVEFDRSADWRDDGPFDISEVDLGADEIDRLDFGALIVTPESGMAIRLVVDARSNEIRQMIIENGPRSAMQLTLLAAPSREDYRAQIRQELIDDTHNAKAVQLAEGPFGTELRRVVTITDERDKQALGQMRDWLIAGPRWVLNVRLVDKAALDLANDGAAAPLVEVVRNLVIRRGDVAMAPGTIIPLTPVS